MTEEQLSYFERANDLTVNIMFCVSSKQLTRAKSETKEYFYTLFCLEIVQNGSYVIFFKIFKPLKRKNKLGTYFNIYKNSTQLLENQNEVNTYLNKLLSMFNEHERAICNFEIETENVPAGEAILLINDWEKSVINYYNNLLMPKKN
jgi:hypothetical protein